MSMPEKTVRKLPILSTTTNAPLDQKDAIKNTIQGALSHDLVFAVIGHVGSGASYVANALREDLEARGQLTRPIRMSKLLQDAAEKLNHPLWHDASSQNGFQRTRALQRIGNWLRETKGLAFTAGLLVQRMHEERSINGGGNQPIAFVIDCLKNRSEVDALRKVYGRSFYLISVVCGPDERRKRLQLKYKGKNTTELGQMAEDDEEDGEAFGQQVRKTIQLGDFFVNNEETPRNSLDPLSQTLTRFLQLVFGSDIVRPTRDERGMYAAWSASLQSSCLSRQVGAAILDRSGQLIATGTNDVPKFDGGLYEEGDKYDHRCFKRAQNGDSGFCRNDKTKQEIYQDIFTRLSEGGVLKDSGVDEHAVRSLIEKTTIADLIEFSRAVHAEMDALISLSRSGAGGSKGGTLYSRTYPCHSCARHIVAAGIHDVIYIEPYTKSRAISLHADSLCESTILTSQEDKVKKVHFRLFTGVAPRRFAALFEERDELKKNGRLHLPEDNDGVHQDPIFTKSHLDFEKSIADQVRAVVESNQERS